MEILRPAGSSPSSGTPPCFSPCVTLCLDTRSRFLLYTTGTPTVGRITGKRLKEYSESEDCILEYEYSPAGVARPERGQVKTRRADWDAAQVGDALTVLYDAQRPALSVAYRYGEYVIHVNRPSGTIMA